MKDIRTLLLGMLSVGLVGTWVYHLYDKTQYSKQKTEVPNKDSVAVANTVRDSLQKIYGAALSNLDTKLDSTRSTADSLKFKLDGKLNEVLKLRSEIGGILKNKNATESDLGIARQKIGQLEGLVDEMKGQKNTMEEEKQRLSDVLTQLTGEINGLQQNMKRLGDENKNLTEKVSVAAVFVASGIRLSPVTVKNDKEQETSLAKKATKLVISFDVQNNVNDYDNTEVYVVVIQPDGEVLKNDIWESSSMDTHDSGRKMYTMKLRFEYIKGETKHLQFSLNADEYQKGNYTLQVYHHGYMIGQAVKTLS